LRWAERALLALFVDGTRIVRCRTMRAHATLFQGVRMETVTL